MKVIICGAGQVGYSIAEHLAGEENDVSVVDTSADLIDKITESLDVQGIIGHGAHPDVLQQAGAEDADMIIAVTFHDEVNMVACQIASSQFDVPTKIARIRDQSYKHPKYQGLFSRDRLDIDVVISPELEVAKMVLRRLSLPGAFETVSFYNGMVTLLGVVCKDDCPVLDTPLRQLSELFQDLNATIVGISRNGQLFVPNSSEPLNAGDEVYIVCATNQIERTLKILGHAEKQAQRVVIAGGGNIGLELAQRLEAMSPQTRMKIVEFSDERAREIAEQLKRTIIINGSALEETILKEANVHNADLMVALTNDDQVNILSSVLAKHIGCDRNLCLINNKSYMTIVRSLGIDAHLNPRSITVSRILQHVRQGRIRNIHSVLSGEAEVIEAQIHSSSSLIGSPLRSLQLGSGLRIGAILRDDELLKITGDTSLRAGDTVIMFVMASEIKNVEQMFRIPSEIF